MIFFFILKRCHRCIKNITSGSFCVSTDHLGSGTGWHPGCFTCATCNELLVDMIYFCRNEEIFCERHYADSIYPRCAACDEVSARSYHGCNNKGSRRVVKLYIPPPFDTLIYGPTHTQTYTHSLHPPPPQSNELIVGIRDGQIMFYEIRLVIRAF